MSIAGSNKKEPFGMEISYRCDGCGQVKPGKGPQQETGVNVPKDWYTATWHGRRQKGIVHGCSPACIGIAIERDTRDHG